MFKASEMKNSAAQSIHPALQMDKLFDTKNGTSSAMVAGPVKAENTVGQQVLF